MLLKNLLVSVAALAGTALAIPFEFKPDYMGEPGANALAKRWTTDCKGPGLCGQVNSGDRDHVGNTLLSRGCYPAGTGSLCKGKRGRVVCNCYIEPKSLKIMYARLRSEGCAKCGTYTGEDGCQLTVNYVNPYECNNN